MCINEAVEKYKEKLNNDKTPKYIEQIIQTNENEGALISKFKKGVVSDVYRKVMDEYDKIMGEGNFIYMDIRKGKS